MNDLSRGATAEEILDLACVTAIQARQAGTHAEGDPGADASCRTVDGANGVVSEALLPATGATEFCILAAILVPDARPMSSASSAWVYGAN